MGHLLNWTAFSSTDPRNGSPLWYSLIIILSNCSALIFHLWLEKKFDDFTLYFLAFNHDGKELSPEEKVISRFSREGLSFSYCIAFLSPEPKFYYTNLKACSSSHTTTGLNQTLTFKDTPMETPIQVEDSAISPLASTMSRRLVNDSTNSVSDSRNDQAMVKWGTLPLFWTLMGELFAIDSQRSLST